MACSPLLFGALPTLALLLPAALAVCEAQEVDGALEKVEFPVPELEPQEPLPGVRPGETGAEVRDEGAMIDPVLLEAEDLSGEPDLYEDLDFSSEELEGLEEAEEAAGEEGVEGPSGLNLEEGFDSGVLLGELLPTVFGNPLEHQGVRFGVGVQATYDSNIFLDEDDEVDDLIFTLSPSVEYRSAPPGVPGLVTVRYTPFLRVYADQSDLNTVDHSASATVNYTGARGSVSVAGNYGRFSRADRFVGGLVETESYSGSATASYQVASRTTLNASLRANFSEDSGRERSSGQLPGSSDNDTMSMQLGGLWQATSQTRVGPSVRYSNSSSATSGDRDALAFLLVAEHSPRVGLNLSGTIGIEKVDSDRFGESGDTDFTGSFAIDYAANERVSLRGEVTYEAIPQGGGQFGRNGGGSRSLNGNLSLRYAPNPDWVLALRASAQSFPSADQGNYSIGDQNYGASVTRNLTNGSVTLDGSLGFSAYDAVGPVATSQDDETFQSVALRYRRGVFADRASLNASAQWSKNSGNRDWDRFQLSLGLDMEF